MKTCVLAALILAAPAMAMADKIDDLKSAGKVTIAIGNEPPYTAIDSAGKVSGAAPDVARAVFARMGIPNLQAQVIEYGAMIPSVQAGRVDAIAAGLFMKPERCAAVAYSEPVLCDAEALLVAKGNAKGLKSYEDIAKVGARVGVPGGSTEEKLALAAGVTRDNAVVVPDAQSGLKMLQDGRLDAYSLPILSLNDLVKKSGDDKIEVVGPIEGTVTCDGVAFNKKDTALRDAFNTELKALQDSGDFAKIVEGYGFSSKAALATTTEALCAKK